MCGYLLPEPEPAGVAGSREGGHLRLPSGLTHRLPAAPGSGLGTALQLFSLSPTLLLWPQKLTS